MNERIRELAEQAGWMMGDEVEGFNIRLEKFAQLIVGECIELNRQELSFAAFSRMMEKYDQHFDIKLFETE